MRLRPLPLYRCKQYVGENHQLNRKVEALESENTYVYTSVWLRLLTVSFVRTLKAEINKLQKLLGAQGNTGKTTRVGACLMVRGIAFSKQQTALMIHLSTCMYVQVIVLCFAVFFGSPTSHNLWSRPPSAYSTSSGMCLCVCIIAKHKCIHVAESLLV